MFWRFKFFSPEGYWKNPINSSIVNTLNSLQKAKLEILTKSIPSEILDKWIMWKVILAGHATLHEMETIYTMKDALQMYTSICIKETIESIINDTGKKV